MIVPALARLRRSLPLALRGLLSSWGHGSTSVRAGRWLLEVGGGCISLIAELVEARARLAGGVPGRNRNLGEGGAGVQAWTTPGAGWLTVGASGASRRCRTGGAGYAALVRLGRRVLRQAGGAGRRAPWPAAARRGEHRKAQSRMWLNTRASAPRCPSRQIAATVATEWSWRNAAKHGGPASAMVVRLHPGARMSVRPRSRAPSLIATGFIRPRVPDRPPAAGRNESRLLVQQGGLADGFITTCPRSRMPTPLWVHHRR